ncbi:chromosome partitioning protein [Umezawaea sp. NPDC059074]|uniref:chromosome partitioning protein n=1 Tax=Umezawaea sp. NPDC059074 TaxID=3346716 RepID=UPI0036A2DCAF
MLVTVCSLKGSPGTTTFATALGARWPTQESPIVVEADPSGGDLAARFRLAESPGLVSLAAAARGHGGDPDLLGQHVQRLSSDLRVVLGPAGAEQSRAALSVLAAYTPSPLRSAASRAGTTVIADCGRVDPDSPALPIIRSADTMLLLVRPHDDELAHVALKLHIAQTWSRRPCLVLVGDGYSDAEVSRVLGIPVLGRVPRDDKGAAVLGGRGNRRHGPSRSAVGRAAAKIAANVHAHRYADPTRSSRVPPARFTSQPLAAAIRNGGTS